MIRITTEAVEEVREEIMVDGEVIEEGVAEGVVVEEGGADEVLEDKESNNGISETA
jgi:hypothetical protein